MLSIAHPLGVDRGTTGGWKNHATGRGDPTGRGRPLDSPGLARDLHARLAGMARGMAIAIAIWMPSWVARGLLLQLSCQSARAHLRWLCAPRAPCHFATCGTPVTRFLTILTLQLGH
jgi:hypothetical protein